MTTSKTAGSPLKTAIGVTSRALSTTLRLVASGASWGARVIDASRTHLEGGSGGGKPPRTRGESVHYVSGELCCVVVGDGLTRDTAPAFYDALWGSLNESAGGLVKEWLGKSPRDARPTSFELDMAPALLGRLAREGRVRQYVGRLGRRPGGHPDRPDEPDQTDEPFVVFEGEGGAPASLLAFCDVARFDGTDEERRRCVPEIVNLLNANVERVNRELAAGLARGQGAVRAARVEALTPNWLAAGAGEFTDAGPGTAPLPWPAQPGRGHWQVELDRVTNVPPGFPPASELVQAERVQGRSGARSGVLVAILDTCPLPEQVTRMAGAHPENTLLHDVAHDPKVRIGDPPSIPGLGGASGALTDAAGKPITPNWREHLERPGLTDDDYLMTDHGVFAAGIVRDIAPRAEIRLIRVLDDYGVGDLLSLIRVMRRLPKLMQETGCEKLVVNLSLVIDLPPDDDLLAWWFPRTSRDTALLRRRFGDVCRIVEMTHASLDRALAWLRVPGRNVLVVAAAGNDHTAAGAARPSPRWPARYDRSLGVAAVDSRGSPAHYSNKGDFVVLGNGVATFGGDAVPGGSAELPGPSDPMIGLFTADVFPLRVPPDPPTPNATSWARWAGTSFATPLISGLAAAIWASEAGASLTPEGVIDAVRGYATSNGSDLDCPYVPAYQRFVSE